MASFTALSQPITKFCALASCFKSGVRVSWDGFQFCDCCKTHPRLLKLQLANMSLPTNQPAMCVYLYSSSLQSLGPTTDNCTAHTDHDWNHSETNQHTYYVIRLTDHGLGFLLATTNKKLGRSTDEKLELSANETSSSPSVLGASICHLYSYVSIIIQ